MEIGIWKLFSIIILFFLIGILVGASVCIVFFPLLLKKLLKIIKDDKRVKSILEAFEKIKDNPLLDGSFPMPPPSFRRKSF